MLKPRMIGFTRAYLTSLVYNMRLEGKTESTLGLIMPKENDATLSQYLLILDSLGTTSTYKEMKSKGKFQGYIFTIKLKPL
jgi:hypothetical protein